MVDASSVPPKLRADLAISQQQQADGAYFVFKDPAAGRFFRFREPECYLARQLDGVCSLDVIRQRAQEKFGCDVSPETLEQFVGALRYLGLLESETAERGSAPRPGRIGGTLLYLRFKAFDPDRLLARLAPWARVFFTRGFLVLSAAAILLGFGITALNWGEIQRDFRGLWRFDALLFAWLTVLVVTAIHEFAHGLTCKQFGGEVHEMGFMLIYFQPAFYCNVSDAWLFPEKSRRLWVTFAGAYTEIFIWALATLIWRFTEPATWPQFIALVVMATSGIKTLFNLNPLIKLDGYYLLGDWLGIPNLRQKSFAYVWAQIKRLWRPAGELGEPVPARDRRIFLVYGLLAGVYSYWLLSLVTMYVGSFLVGRYQAVGLLLFAFLLALTFQTTVVKAFRALPAAISEAPRKIAARRWPAKSWMPLAVLPLVLFLVRMEMKVTGEFKVLPVQNAEVRAEVEGIIEAVPLDEGALVKKGDLIAQLSDRDYRAEFQKIEAEMEEKKAGLKMLQAGPRQEEIQLARKEVETARTRLDHASRQHEELERLHATQLSRARTNLQMAREKLTFAGKDLERFNLLFKEGVVSRKQLEEAEQQMRLRGQEAEMAQAELRMTEQDQLAEARKELALARRQAEETELKLKLLLAGSRPEQIEAAEAERARLETQRRYLEESLARVRVLSPVSGVITTPRLKEKVGQRLQKGDLVATVHELSQAIAEIAVSEKEIADVKLGQAAVLKARAYPDKLFSGSVAAIAPAVEQDELRRKVVRVKIALENSSSLLKSDMSGHAKIYCGKRPIFTLLTQSFSRYIRVEFWSWW